MPQKVNLWFYHKHGAKADVMTLKEIKERYPAIEGMKLLEYHW